MVDQMKAVVKDIPTKEENTMNTDARYALKSDLRKSRDSHYCDSRKHHHVDHTVPESMAQFVDLIKRGKFEGSDDEKIMNEKHPCGDVCYAFRFREHPADFDGHIKTVKTIDEAYRDIMLKTEVLPEDQALKHVEDYRKKTFH